MVFDWIQIVSSLALLIGIGLVIWELQQSRELAEAQFISDGFQSLHDSNLVMQGENAAEVFARACDDPASLSSEDARVMEALVWNKMLLIGRRQALFRASGFFGEDSETGWSAFAGSNLRSIFSTQFGRDWWKTTKQFWGAEVTAIGDEVLAQLGSPGCTAFYDSLLGKESATSLFHYLE